MILMKYCWSKFKSGCIFGGIYGKFNSTRLRLVYFQNFQRTSLLLFIIVEMIYQNEKDVETPFRFASEEYKHSSVQVHSAGSSKQLTFELCQYYYVRYGLHLVNKS